MTIRPPMTIEALAGWAAERCRRAQGRNGKVRDHAEHTHALVEHPLFGLPEVLFPMPLCGTTGAFYDLAAIELNFNTVDCALCIVQLVAGQRTTAADRQVTTDGPL